MKLRLIGLLTALLLALCLGCAGDEGSGSEDINFPVSRDLTFTARNTGPNPIHIYMQGGDRGQSNRVPAGETRTFHTSQFTWDSQSDFNQINFEASNDLGDLGFANVTYTGTELRDHRGITVTWNGTGLTATKD
jgi:hypothetical protein